MSIFHPQERRVRITDIDPTALVRRGIRAVVLDIDNTLTTHDNPIPADGVLDWLRTAESVGLQLILLSNNCAERVLPFAQLLTLEFEANARKPLTGGFRRACRRMGVRAGETAVIGDQIFTDILGGRLAGAYCILVDPIEPEHTRFFRIKRRLEQPILRRYDKRRNRDER